MRNLRYFFRLLSAFLSRFKALILLGIVVGIVGFLLVSIFGKNLLSNKTETIGIVGKYRVDTLPKAILSLIGSGLTTVDESGTVLPGLAKSWESTDGGKTWTFYLNENVLWQDGKKVTSDTINYSFSDATIEKPNPTTIVFKLQSPFAPFPSVVSEPTFKKGLLGTGEWKVSKATLIGSYVQRLTMVNKNGEKKIFKFYPTEERAKLAYKLGSINTLQGIFTVSPFDTWRNTTVKEEINTYRYAALFFNNQDPLLSEKSLRQALAYAIDKDSFNGIRAFGPISPDSWAYNPQVKPYTYDEKRAKELYDALPKEIKEKKDIKLSTSVILLSTAEKIAESWKKLGFNVTVEVPNGVPTDFQVLLSMIDIPTDPDQYALWHSTQSSTNITKYSNPRIDKLLEDGRIEVDMEVRKKIYLDFQRYLVEDLPAIFLDHPISYTVERN
jgi:peptide/nickel transport system substrate-binding protein